MDTDSWMLFILLLTLIMGGGYFASAETAYASVNPMRIRHRAENNEKAAIKAQYVLNNFNKALSTLLIGNNIMHIGTASIATFLVTKLWGEGYTAISTIVTTVVVFLISEMIPKQFAKDRPEDVALLYASSLSLLMKLLTPVSFLFDSISNFMTRFFKAKTEPTITEDELMEMIDNLSEGGDEDDEQRSELLMSALKFDDAIVWDVMTPIKDVVSVASHMRSEEIFNIIRESKFTRIPVYQGIPENIIGIMDVRAYIKRYIVNKDSAALRFLIKHTLYVLDTERLDDVFDKMTQSKTHMAIVRDATGKCVGIVTMEDVLEQLVGEIYDEDDVSPEDDADKEIKEAQA
ncbi:MAG: HlyC/CorC family transporter [Clostridiales bacterium]|nr:HlyC/CorC family transporter [Clostridiales bacterium]